MSRSRLQGAAARARLSVGQSIQVSALALAACAPRAAPLPVERPATPEIVQIAQSTDPAVRAAIVGGEAPVPVPPGAVQVNPRRGDITVNFPSADVRVVAKAVLGDLLRAEYSVANGVSGPVSFVTPGPVARSALLGLFEDALKASGLALVPVAGGFEIRRAAGAASGGPVAPGTIGYGTEIVTLSFVNADQLKALLDSVVPGVVTATDPARNALTIVGTTGQRNSARELIRQFDVNWLRSMSFAVFVPERTDARLIAPELEKLINAADAPTRGLVRLITMERLNGVLAISAQRQYLDDVRRWVEILDREGQSSEPKLFVYRVQNGRARDLAQTLNAAFGNSTDAAGATGGDPFAPAGAGTGSAPTGSTTTAALTRPPAPPAGAAAGAAATPGAAGAPVAGAVPGAAGATTPTGGRITADEVNNAIIVYGTPREYAVIEDALRRLDIRPVQVMIEAAITEVALTDELRYGIQWNFQVGDSNFALTEGGSAVPSRNFPGFSYFLSNNDIRLTLNALEQRTNLKVISAPKVLVLNNQTAALQVGDQVPVSTASATNLNGGDSIVNSIEYRDTGVILKVTPRVNGSGLVLLDIAQEVSNVSAPATNTGSTDQSPTISTRRVATSIAAQDGQVIALGGLFSSSRSFGKNGIPILSRIPVLGSLFGNHNNVERRTELIVLLKPHVIRTVEDGTAITEELRRKLRTLEPFRTGGRIP